MKKTGSAVLQPLEKESLLRRFVRFCAGLKDSEYIYLCAAFLLPFAIMLGIYACMEMHPFGNNSVLMLDLQAQYIYYYEEIRSLLTEGGSFLYSWKRTLGGEFMGIFAYYLSSPFSLIVALFPIVWVIMSSFKSNKEILSAKFSDFSNNFCSKTGSVFCTATVFIGSLVGRRSHKLVH